MEKETRRLPVKNEDQQPTIDPKKESDFSGLREFNRAVANHAKKSKVRPWNPTQKYSEEELAELRGDKEVVFDLAHPVLPTDRDLNPAAFGKLFDEVEQAIGAYDEKEIIDLIKNKRLHRINLETIYTAYYNNTRKDHGGLKKKVAAVLMATMSKP